jgi:uncharacterized membrane protein
MLGNPRKSWLEQIYLAIGANMVPFFILLLSFVVLRSAGLLGVTPLNNVDLPLRIALLLMFLVAASAHWGKGRPDLIRMVPPAFPHAAILVSVTGVLEILRAVGLLVSVTAMPAAVCLAILLTALFPANIRAARERQTIRGYPAPGLFIRGAIQVIFLSALIIVIMHNR